MDLIRYSVLISLYVNEKFYSAKIERKDNSACPFTWWELEIMVCWRGWIYSVCQEKEKNLLIGVAEPQAEEEWGEQQREKLVVIPPSLIYLLTDIKTNSKSKQNLNQFLKAKPNKIAEPKSY